MPALPLPHADDGEPAFIDRTVTLAREAAVALERAGAPAAHLDRLADFAALVLEANATTNLTAARDPVRFASQILDALTLTDLVDGPLIDVGSGAGLPGIPLGIVTGHRVVLIDSVRKKAAFLSATVERLGLAGEALARRAEDLAHESAYRGRFACATARAVASAPAVAELTIPFLVVGGRALLQRGRMEDVERDALRDAAVMLGADVIDERVLDNERRIMRVRKTADTPARFPRRPGVPAKRPLCLT